MKIKVCCENVEDIIYALDSIADAIERAKDAIENPEKPFSFDGLKKVIDTFNEKAKSREKSGSFGESWDKKKKQQPEEKNHPQFDEEAFLETELAMSLIAYVNKWADDIVWRDKHSDLNISVAIHKEYFKIYQIALQQFYGIFIQFEYRMLNDGENDLEGYIYYLDTNGNKHILFSILK